MQVTDDIRQKLTKYLAQKIDAQYFGKVILVFQDGRVTHIVEEKSLKLESMKNNGN